MKTIAQLVSEIDAFDGFGRPHLELIAGCGRTASFRDGELMLHEGDRAETFFAIREGSAMLELTAPPRPPLVIQTVHAGEALGWSWLFEPYRVRFDTRARGTVHALAFDGACLRGKCEEDHDFGYVMMRHFARIAIGQLQATRVRLLDIYGEPAPA